MAVFAVCELLLSPIGLPVTTKLAPEAFRAQMMALYFFSVGLGTSMSGVLARYDDPAHEFAYFGIIGAVAVFAGVVVFAIAPWISRLMEGVHQVGALVGVPCTTTGSNQPARISCSIGGSMLPPDTITTVRPCGVEPFR